MNIANKNGILFGLLCPGSLVQAKKEPVAYFYPSLVLPALPEWDKSEFPYALLRHYKGIAEATQNIEYYSMLVFDQNAHYFTSNDKVYFGGQTDDVKSRCVIYRLYAGETEWSKYIAHDNFSTGITSDGKGYGRNASGEYIYEYTTQWASFKVMYNDICVMPASTPVPAGNGMAAYKGVRLPKLPEWDKTAYPYAMISGWVEDEVEGWILVVLPDKFNAILTSNGDYRLTDGGPLVTEWYPAYIYELSIDDDWYRFSTHPLSGLYPMIWSNYDIHTKDGELVLAASEPIPIYE